MAEAENPLHSWTDDERAKIRDFMEKQGVSKNCCEKPNWYIGPNPISMPVALEIDQSRLRCTTGVGVPFVAMYCSHCGHMTSFILWSVMPESVSER